MSPLANPAHFSWHGFPRVSGDEPEMGLTDKNVR